MSYKDKFGITDIKNDNIGNLSIAREHDDDPKQEYPQFLFIPDMSERNHYHIPLNLEQAKILYNWLSEYLKEYEVHEWTKTLREDVE